MNVGLGDPWACSLPSTLAWIHCWTAPLGSQRLPRAWWGWRNRCLAKTIPAQSWRFQLGGEAVGQRAAQPAANICGAGPGRSLARVALPTSLASRWPLPSFLGLHVGSGDPQVWEQMPAVPLTGFVTWGKWLCSLCLSFHF